MRALEIELAALPLKSPPPTIYVGGGTPSALREEQLERLLSALDRWRADGQELTFEVNPRSATAAKIRLLSQAKVNRVSFGAQTFDAPMLKLLGRRHGPEDIGRVYKLLRDNIPSLSFDLIFALPSQTLAAWEEDLRLALQLAPDHLSVYSLIYELETPLTRQLERNEVVRVPEELEREMFLLAIDTLGAAGYEHYEVSSHAQSGHRARHNQVYWSQGDYLGVGPGATSTLGCSRFTNVPDLEAYMQGIETHGVPPRTEETLSPQERMQEHVLLRLRTRDGLDLQAFENAFGVTLSEYSQGALERMLGFGLLALEHDRLRLTREGLCVADKVIADLVV